MIGETLRLERERQGISLKEAAERSKIPLRFLSALEKLDYASLGGLLYVKRYVKNYAAFLGIFSEELMEECIREFEIGTLKTERTRRIPYIRSLLLPIQPKHAVLIAGTSLSLLIAGYLMYQLVFLLEAPDIAVYEPTNERSAAPLPSIEVRGEIAKDARVLINRRPVAIAEDGGFRERLYLVKGLNRIDIEAVNISGKAVSETRYVMGY